MFCVKGIISICEYLVNYGRFISEQEFKELKQDLKVSNLSAYAASTRKNQKV